MANTFPKDAPYHMKNFELHHNLKRQKDDKIDAEQDKAKSKDG